MDQSKIDAARAKLVKAQAEFNEGVADLLEATAPVVEPPKEEPKPPVVVPPVVTDPALAKIAVNSLAELTKAAAAAKVPTQITLSSGKHGILTLKGLKTAALTIVLTGATLQGVRVQGCENIGIIGARSILDGSGSQVQVKDSALIAFTDCETTDGTTYGFSALNSQIISFVRCKAARVKDGFQANGCDRLYIKDAHVRAVTSDGMTFAACSNVHIDGFDVSDFNPSAGAHPDVIQFFTKGTSAPSKNITIENVRYVRGKGGGIAQGIFITDQTGSLPYENITIRNCRIEGGMYNGIKVANAKGVTITGCTVQPYEGMDSRIDLERVTGAVLTDNAYTKLLSDPTTKPTVTGDRIIKAIAA